MIFFFCAMIIAALLSLRGKRKMVKTPVYHEPTKTAKKKSEKEISALSKAEAKEREARRKAEAKAQREAEAARKKQFDKEQAEFDVDFLERRLDSLNVEYWDVKDRIAAFEDSIRFLEMQRNYSKADKERKELARLEKKLRSLDADLHATEKRLRTAQYKAGRKILN